MVTATDSVLGRLDTVQNKALRIITGAAKSTPILAMQLQAEIESLKDRRQMNGAILYERVLRNGDYWASTLGNTRRLKTQLTFIEATKSIITSLGLNFEIREPLPDLTKQRVWTCPYAIVLDLIIPINKSMTLVEELRTVALATIAERYPEPEWIHIYTDGSATEANKNAGAGVYNSLFQLSAPAGANATNFDGEVAAITLALEKLTHACVTKVVLLSDSRAALLAIASGDPLTNARILACRKSIECKRKILTVLVMQWIPAHCGIYGNEEADRLARLGARQPQPLLPVTMDMAKEMVRSATNKRAEERSRGECGGKNWAALLDPKRRPPLTLPRAVSVACFRLASGHDY
ncbi:uncharacterized protein [Halyomorpha halys]|uniref:uncharacterized protein n=1 Tax=Halyomorpha halys TaxID=286706 RepID=UPI0006D50477|nr:uncharacterized protein LOC106688787 [Halyomorpha halys]